FEEAVKALDRVKQTRSAVDYSEEFNHLLRVVNVHGAGYDPRILCVKYRAGLKEILQKENDLYDIADDLVALQTLAQRRDLINWERGKSSSSDSKHAASSSKGKSSVATNTSKRDDPMQLANAEGTANAKKSFRKLTKEEKEEYRKSNRCSFCRRNGHIIDDCRDPRKRASTQGASVNNTEASTGSGDAAANVSRAPLKSTTRSVEPASSTTTKKETSAVKSQPPQSRHSTPAFKDCISNAACSPPTPKTSKRTSVFLELYHLGLDTPKGKLIVLNGELASKRISVLVDTGADPSFINARLASKLGFVIDKRHAFDVKTASSTRSPLEGYACIGAPLKIGTYSEELDLVAADIAYDVILGIDWLRRKKAQFDWDASGITFDEHRLVSSHPPTPTMESNPLGAISVKEGTKSSIRRLIRHPNAEIGLLWAKPVSPPATLNNSTAKEMPAIKGTQDSNQKDAEAKKHLNADVQQLVDEFPNIS
ncbi:hypothetical protein HDU96_003027, partial [Phlyctochytrium bullatum]